VLFFFWIVTQVERVQGFRRERRRPFIIVTTQQTMMDGEKDTTKYAKMMAPALLDFLNPELPNPET
jgi:hypothetical protein